ncbi:UNVERIFIED_CONTAM: putative mitochondrial protein [Sesamum angustifolium]|uniref:Mitochondrial protein n=1 Tax=Sesamum angustifolium TaxID=2727405 RepID=A0AAW2INC9_9LAMI
MNLTTISNSHNGPGKESVAIKLDMSKVHDRVEWNFLCGILLRLGFGHRFVALIMLLDVEHRGRLTGVAMARQALRVSHLLFVDDTPMFCKATTEQIGEIRQILRIYARALGIVGWNASLLSQAGKGLLMKVVLQSLPTYAMSCFQLPITLVRSLEAHMADFWWHSRGEKRTHWVAWWKLCRPLGAGELGFQEFNLALLAKQGWRILTRPGSLLSRVLKVRYFPDSSLGEAWVGARSSLTWRGICAAKPLLEEGVVQERAGMWRWGLERKGHFSLKSTCRLAVMMRD